MIYIFRCVNILKLVQFSMERIISLVLKEFSDENISIDVNENSVKIVTSSNSITINNRIRETRTGIYRSRRNVSGNVIPVKDEGVWRPSVTESMEQTAKITPIKERLSVIGFDKSLDLYREITNDFIVKQKAPGLIEVLGKLDKDSNIISLTSEDSLIARNMGLYVPDK